ncbi:MAG: ATP-dependent RNA helicase RhlE [Saprospiraceae bacterium]
MTFKDFNFEPSLQEALSSMGFLEPTPIQQEAIPIITEGHDIIACAQTGTGKTAAFLLPVLNKIAKQGKQTTDINTLIIAPTRELALQIDQQVEGIGYFLGVSSLPVYGGGDSDSWTQQKSALTKGADIIIATPGRFISHINLGYVNLDKVEHLILDEADRMLDMGFYDDIMLIVSKLPKDRQTLLFSATMPGKIRTLAKTILRNPKQVSLAMSKPAEGVLQGAYMVYDSQKIPLIVSLLNGKTNYPSIIIFTSTKRMVREINAALIRKNFKSLEISSDLEQKEREKALGLFKNKKVQILVATDILARGIDIKEISLIINYDVPGDAEDYVHRVGRTARADATGVALTFISDRDQHKFYSIEQLIGETIMKAPNPPEVGKGPDYDPKSSRGGGGSYRGRGGGGGGGRSGGGGGGGKRKPFPKKRYNNPNK